MPWFIKTETFRVSPLQARPHLAAHRAWVSALRAQGVAVSSGYLVDGQGQPGGGGLLLLAAEDHAAAEVLVRQDPMVRSGCVDWQLQGWIPAVGDLAMAPVVQDIPGDPLREGGCAAPAGVPAVGA